MRAGFALVVIALSGCATHYAPDVVADPYGFLSGVWHGMVLPWALLASVMSWIAALVGISIFESVQFIGRPNTGLWYYVGFCMGPLSYGGGMATR